MTRQEAGRLLSVLKTAYPNGYRNFSQEDADAAARLWALVFSDESCEAVSTAVYYRIAAVEDPFPPTPGEIRGLLERLRSPEAETPSEAWAAVRKALSNSIYGSEEEFGKLSPAAKLAVGSAERLRQMAMDGGFSESVEESHFLRAYGNCSRRLAELRLIPAAVRERLPRLGEMPGGAPALAAGEAP